MFKIFAGNFLGDMQLASLSELHSGCAHTAGRAPCGLRYGVALYNSDAYPLLSAEVSYRPRTTGMNVEPVLCINQYRCVSHSEAPIQVFKSIHVRREPWNYACPAGTHIKLLLYWKSLLVVRIICMIFNLDSNLTYHTLAVRYNLKPDSRLLLLESAKAPCCER